MPKKRPNKAQQTRMGKLVEAGCIVCYQMGYTSPAEIHHVTDGKAMRDHNSIIALCPTHHRNGGYGVAIHAGRKEWEKNHGPEQRFLAVTNQLFPNEEV